MKSKFSRFLDGLTAPFRGGHFLLRHPKLLMLAMVPVIILIILVIVGLVQGWGFVSGVLATYLPQLSVQTGSIWFWLSSIFAYVLFSILLFLGLLLGANVLASPINGLIAEKILKLHKVIPERDFNLAMALKSMTKMFLISLVRSAIFLSIGAALLVLGFIPILHIFVWFAGALLIVFDCADYSLEVLEKGLRARFAIYRERIYEFSGAAVGLGLTLLIPGLNFVMLPSTVAGCCLLVVLFEQQKAGTKS